MQTLILVNGAGAAAHPARRGRELGRSPPASSSARRSRAPDGHLRGPRRARGLARLQQRACARLRPTSPARETAGRRSHAHVLLLRHVRQSRRWCCTIPTTRSAHLITAKHWHNVQARRAALHHRRHRLGQGGVGQVLRPVAHGGVRAHVRLRPLPCRSRSFALIRRYGVTTLCCPPTMYRLMIAGGRGRLRPVARSDVLHHGRRGAQPRSVRLLAASIRA